MNKVAKGMRPNAGRWGLTCLPVLPEVSVLAAEMFVHGIKRTHTSVLLQPDPI